MHGDKFDYSLCEYNTAKTKVKIICPIHEDFFQTPDKHLAKNSKGCPSCWEDSKPAILKESRKKRELSGEPIKTRNCIPKKELLKRFKDKYGDKYSYKFLEDKGTQSKIQITCPKHGTHKNTAQAHMQSVAGCPKCGLERKNASKTKNYDFVINQLSNKHSDFYEYPDSNRATYKNKKSKIEIICPKHGPFYKSAQKHLSGQGCWPCKVESLIENGTLVGGYSNDLFEERPELSTLPAKIYFLKINKDLFKIGITRVSVDRRVASLTWKSKGEIENVEILFIQEGELKDCFLLEQSILDEFSDSRVYKPWSSELFSENVLGETGFPSLS